MSEKATKSEKTIPNLNGSGLRVLKLLQWLNERPLSTDEFNERFNQHPLINKKLSGDSIWLYINTLKALGCEIERPKPTNDFKYVLKKHPFGIYLKDRNITRLAQVKKWTEKKLKPHQWLNFSRFFKNTLDYVWLREAQTQSFNSNALMMSDSRSLDYEAFETTARCLQDAIQEDCLTYVRYQSPVKGAESFYFLPQKCRTRNGALYVLGYQQERDALVQLRLDRIIDVEQVVNDDLKDVLKQKATELPVATIFVVTDDPDYFLELDGEVARKPVVKNQVSGLEIQLQTRDSFSLRQQLFSSGCVFQVVKPVALRNELQSQLKQMLSYYGDERQ